MSTSRAEIVDRNLRNLLREWEEPPDRPADPLARVRPGSTLTGYELLDLLECQFQARWLDLVARRLKERGVGFYTIGSAGHEGNAGLAAALRVDDPAFLHYRSGGFFARRARERPAETPIFDVLLGLCAAAEEPIAGGRHKVFGSRSLWVPPQTSTIASHLPKAMGTAFSIDRGEYLGLELPVPGDAVVACTFGDASLNHSTALGALNASMWGAFQHLPLPVVWVCEDNGLGISVQTPENWIETVWGESPAMPYLRADGTDVVDVFDKAVEAVRHCRQRRAPVFLHLRVVRLLGHAGTDPELAYHDIERIKASESRDPLLVTCRRVLRLGLARPERLLALYEEIGERVEAASEEAATRAHHRTVESIVAPLAPHDPDRVRERASESADPGRRREHWGGEERLPEAGQPEHLAKQLNRALHDLMLQYSEMLVFGEDVARRGGVYGVTAGLWDKFGGGRAFNTLLDEQSILGVAIGAGHLGLLPVPEIQYLAYLHNAIDQIRGEASSLQFFSRGQFRNPMVVRIASFAYQKGFGGHFHNDNSIAALRDIPGLVLAAPARADDAVGMLRTAMALAAVDGRVVTWLEPIALYMTRDLHEEGDGGWRFPYPEPGEAVELGSARAEGDERADLTIVSWANGLWRSLRAARTLRKRHGLGVRVVDLRWLQPLDLRTIGAEASRTGRVLVVDEGRRTGGLSEGIFTAIVEECGSGIELDRVCGEDTFIPLGPAWNHVLPSEDSIVEGALALAGRGSGPAAAPRSSAAEEEE